MIQQPETIKLVKRTGVLLVPECNGLAFSPRSYSDVFPFGFMDHFSDDNGYTQIACKAGFPTAATDAFVYDGIIDVSIIEKNIFGSGKQLFEFFKRNKNQPFFREDRNIYATFVSAGTLFVARSAMNVHSRRFAEARTLWDFQKEMMKYSNEGKDIKGILIST